MRAFKIRYIHRGRVHSETVWARSAEKAQAVFGLAPGETLISVVEL